MELQKPVKGVFFDLGWTLLYPPSGQWYFTQEAAAKFSPENSGISVERIDAAMKRAQANLMKDHFVPDEEKEYAQFHAFFTDFCAALPELCVTKQEIDDMTAQKVYDDDFYTFFPETPNVLDTLSAQGYRLGIISDTWPSLYRVLRKKGLLDYFHHITFSCDLGVLKPDPLMYAHAIQGLGLPAGKTIFVDDLIGNVLGAQQAGIQPVLITACPTSVPDNRVVNIPTLAGLLPQLGI